MARVSEKLSPPQLEKVAGHEIGHVIDQVAGEIPVTGLNAELRQLYNTLQSGTERTRNLVEPKHWGYRCDEIPREYMAESIRAYMTDPNYIKTVAPKTAARIGDAAPRHRPTGSSPGLAVIAVSECRAVKAAANLRCVCAIVTGTGVSVRRIPSLPKPRHRAAG